MMKCVNFSLRRDPVTLTPLDKSIIKALQEDFPDTITPYKTLSRQLNIPENHLLEKICHYQQTGILRRLGGVVRHNRIGYHHNMMVVWQVPEYQLADTGRHMAARPEISHCYARPTYPNWPYNLFTMVHGTSSKACNDFVKEMALETGIRHYQKLTSLKELKKTSMKYFTE
jgi:siroheme decarboxylase